MKDQISFSRVIFLMVTLFTLSACSGGSSDTPGVIEQQQATDATANTSEVGVSKLTVNGVISGSSRFNPELILTVGDQVYSEPSFTGDNQFSFEIDPAGAADDVYLEASDSATALTLLSYEGAFGDIDLASSSALRVSEITTAAFALAKAQMSDEEADVSDQIDELLSDVSTSELTFLAAVQYFLMSDFALAVVPPVYDDSFELLVDIARLQSTFVNDLESLFPGVIDTAKDEVLSTEFVYQEFSDDNPVGVYLGEDTNVVYALYANGSGRADFFDDDFAKTLSEWRIGSEGELMLEYQPLENRTDELRLLNATKRTKQTMRSQKNSAGVVDPATAATFSYFAFASGFDLASAPGTYTLGDSMTITLLAGGGGNLVNSARNTDEAILWRIDGEGRIVVNSVNRGITHLMTQLHDGAIENPVLYSQVLSGGDVESMTVESFAKL